MSDFTYGDKIEVRGTFDKWSDAEFRAYSVDDNKQIYFYSDTYGFQVKTALNRIKHKIDIDDKLDMLGL